MRQEIRPETVIICPSPLLGYGLDALLNRLPASTHVVGIEVTPQLAQLTEEHLPEGIRNHPRFSLCLSGTERELAALLYHIGPGTFRRAQLLSLSGGFALASTSYRELANAADETIRLYWQNRATTMFMGRLWIENLFANLPISADAPPLFPADPAAEDHRPAIVLGAGPSLPVALRALRLLRAGDPVRGASPETRPGGAFHGGGHAGAADVGSGHAGAAASAEVRPFVIAVDTAFAACRAAGIEPDLVVAVEAQAVNVIDFVGASESTAACALDMAAYRGTARHFPSGRRRFFLSRFAETRLLDRLAAQGLLPAELPPLGSVGVAAVHIATRLTGGPITLCGLDFAVLPDATHGPGTAPAIRHEAEAWRLSPYQPPRQRLSPLHPPERSRCTVPAARVFTTELLRSYHAQLTNLLAETNNDVVNANTFGIDIPRATTCCTPEELLRALQEQCAAHPNRGPLDHGRAASTDEGTSTEDAAPPTDPTGRSRSQPNGQAGRARSQPNGQAERSPDAGARGDRNAALRFLSEEAALLEKVVALARELVAESESPKFAAERPAYQELCRLLETCDYLYLGFADREELPIPTVSFVSRVAESATRYAGRIRKTLSQHVS
jgi:hypothetical protein